MLRLSFLLVLLACPAGAKDAPVSEEKAIAAIVGESAGQPYQVKLAVADAIRNRHSLRGVYGVYAEHNQTEPAWVWQDARRAWVQSAQLDITHGATHFGNASDVAKGTFIGMKLTCIFHGRDPKGRDDTFFFRR